MSPAAAIVTLCGLGRVRPAPGTVASLVAAIAAFGVAMIGGRISVLLVGIFAMAFGSWAAEHYARESGHPDPSECVIDEVAGQFLACAFAPRTLLGFTLAFLLFRALDIFKPWPISLAERLPGGLGIVADDVVAGVIAGLVIIILVQILPLPLWGRWLG
ncbi:MAG TPA: phosphatidylglycerophosphatase A [Rhizomicrobium sp.]|jgi:phosphatidylglycerophosphatase A|nr:phosphatidylglycerophosphatase A [Rhizomicrobium sp.]